MTKKLLILLLSLIILLSCVSCNSEDVVIPDDESQEFEVIFFDTDNTISDNGKSYTNLIKDINKKNNNSDCYIVKCGDTEILFDCGSQLTIKDESNFCKTLLPKIAKYCDDGILEYLIVTHGDHDHIEGLAVDGGLFDMISDYKYWYANYGKRYFYDENKENPIYQEDKAPIEKIENIIDFNSPWVIDILYNDKSQNSEYGKYIEKRNKVIKKCESHYCPASYLFSQVSGSSVDSSCHNYYAVPSEYKDVLNDPRRNVNIKTITSTSENIIINEILKKSIENIDKVLPDLESYGKLNEVYSDDNNGKRYTYDIDINGNTKLRILYNWYYDSYYKQSFNNDIFVSQCKNNVSVCCLIESEQSKLLLLGDLGGFGEDGLLNYYGCTDVLNSISCFKASHHGSTKNNENSNRLFQMITPSGGELVVVVTGVAQTSRDYYDKNTSKKNQSHYDTLSSVAVIKKMLFDNMTKGVDGTTKVYCTQILESNEKSTLFFNQPFYGDITVSFGKTSHYVHYSYKGKITTFIDNDNRKYSFKTENMDIKELEWAKLIEIIE